jgi:predicted MFS family arabinose efflux permease
MTIAERVNISPGEFRKHWPVVMAASAGFGFSAMVSVTTGLFMEPLGNEFGWGRALQASGASITAVLTFAMSPFFGMLIDRWGTRWMALVGIVFASLVICSFSLANGSPVQWMMLWAVYAFAGVMIKSTVWTAAISSVFKEGRGMALGLTLSGTAVAQIIFPPLTDWLINTYGWRGAWIGLGLGGGAFTFVICLFFFIDGYAIARSKQAMTGEKAKGPLLDVPGLSIAQAWRDTALWRIGLSTFIMMVVTIALNVHQFEILRATGITRTAAAYYSSIAGFAGIAGKLITGALLDRYHVRWVGGLTLGMTTVAFALLLLPNLSPPIIVAAMVVNGYSAGTKLQVASYLTSAYGGLRNFGAMFGVMASLIAAGSGLGPVAAGLIFDSYGSYDPFLVIGIVASIVSSGLIISLGAYPVWGSSTDISEKST